MDGFSKAFTTLSEAIAFMRAAGVLESLNRYYPMLFPPTETFKPDRTASFTQEFARSDEKPQQQGKRPRETQDQDYTGRAD